MSLRENITKYQFILAKLHWGNQKVIFWAFSPNFFFQFQDSSRKYVTELLNFNTIETRKLLTYPSTSKIQIQLLRQLFRCLWRQKINNGSSTWWWHLISTNDSDPESAWTELLKSEHRVPETFSEGQYYFQYNKEEQQGGGGRQPKVGLPTRSSPAFIWSKIWSWKHWSTRIS